MKYGPKNGVSSSPKLSRVKCTKPEVRSATTTRRDGEYGYEPHVSESGRAEGRLDGYKDGEGSKSEDSGVFEGALAARHLVHFELRPARRSAL
ncbi:MAG: hypothetical protein ACR2N0_09810 [Rubrobacteraceae bacterium]